MRRACETAAEVLIRQKWSTLADVHVEHTPWRGLAACWARNAAWLRAPQVVAPDRAHVWRDALGRKPQAQARPGAAGGPRAEAEPAPAGLVLEHVHRSLDDDSEPAWVRAEDNRIEVTIDAPGAYVFAARGVNVATGTVLCEARTAVFELNEPTETLETLAPLKDDATASTVRSRAGRRSSVVLDVGAKRLWLSEHVRFHGNATTIHEDSSELIDQLALMLRTHPNVDSVRLEGHTNSKCGLDCVGGDHKCSNGVCQKLFGGDKGGAVAFSLGRAQAVADALVARGIDLPKVNHVIMYDLPRDANGFIHRAGRTARRGQPGLVSVLVKPFEMKLYHALRRGEATGTALQSTAGRQARVDAADAREEPDPEMRTRVALRRDVSIT